MTGELGTFIQDEQQIGGFFDWISDLLLDPFPTKERDQEYKMKGLKLHTEEIWLFKKPSSPQMIVRLYQHIGDRMVLVMQRDATVNLPEIPLNQKLKYPLEISWMS
ncbi:MAG: hypothetical protein PHV11_08930 [Candidatus Bipolaricaulis sp.]|nr:hypothetical protein [Candidatus Bipolaricaulis sp.]